MDPHTNNHNPGHESAVFFFYSYIHCFLCHKIGIRGYFLALYVCIARDENKEFWFCILDIKWAN